MSYVGEWIGSPIAVIGALVFLCVLPLVPPLAMLVLAIVLIVVIAAIVAIVVAIIATPFLLVRAVRRRRRDSGEPLAYTVQATASRSS